MEDQTHPKAQAVPYGYGATCLWIRLTQDTYHQRVIPTVSLGVNKSGCFEYAKLVSPGSGKAGPHICLGSTSQEDVYPHSQLPQICSWNYTSLAFKFPRQRLYLVIAVQSNSKHVFGFVGSHLGHSCTCKYYGWLLRCEI